MPTEPRPGRIVHGSTDDVLYVRENMRRCATCDEPKFLDSFMRYPGGSPNHPERVSVDCKGCLANRRAQIQQERAMKGEDILGTALARATGRRALLDAAPKSSDGVRLVIEFLGGERRAYKLVARALRRGMKADHTGTAIKASAAFTDFVVRAEKQAGPPIDLSELTDEDRMMILMEPAKQLLLESQEMRQLLLNDPEVRNAVLKDAGVTVLEVTKNGE